MLSVVLSSQAYALAPAELMWKNRCTGTNAGFAILNSLILPEIFVGGVWRITSCRRMTAACEGHVHYNHQDSCKDFRWTAKESYGYLQDRPWEDVKNFYFHLAAGRFSLTDLVFPLTQSQVSRTCGNAQGDAKCFGEFSESEDIKILRDGKWARRTFKIHLSYDGSYFDGWQKQPGLNTVQGLLEKTLGKFVMNKCVEELEAKGVSVEATVAVAGRTDKGVSACQQVCSFYTWKKDITIDQIEAEVNASAPRRLRVLSVFEVPREFHPNFSAKWRRYLYILPLHEGEGSNMQNGQCSLLNGFNGMSLAAVDASEGLSYAQYAANQEENAIKPQNFDILKVNGMLQQLEGQCLSYRVFARDTQASRSRGPATECFMHHARAAVAEMPYITEDVRIQARRVMCIELVANRFLRKMVRVLVATAVRESAAGADADILIKLMEATCRRASAPPAPPEGLCLVDIGYQDVNDDMYFIN